MTKKRKKGQKFDKGESLYKPGLVDRVRDIILEVQPLKADGTLHYGKIAKIMGIALRTLSNWRNPESGYYKPKFANALIVAYEELTELIDLRKTKRAMIDRAQPHKLIKKIKEVKVKGPKIPPLSGMDKQSLQKCLKGLNSKIKIDKKWTNGDFRLKITAEVEKQTTEKMVLVRQEEQQSLGNTADGKHVTSNIGPKDKRWISQEKLEVEGKSLADIAAIMSGKKSGG